MSLFFCHKQCKHNEIKHLNIVFPATKYTLSHINKTKPKIVCPSTFFFCWIRDKKLELNNKNILDSIVRRSSINSQNFRLDRKSNNQDAIFSREHNPVKTLTKIIFDLLQWQKIATLSPPKKAGSLFSFEQHFAGIFASEPMMTLPEIDHVSFFAEHA